MEDRKDERPDCFGILDRVFPKTKDGLRSSPETCFPCHYKTECLKHAMEGIDGLKVQEEKVDIAYQSGMISFFERWSRKKIINQKLKS